MSDSAQIKKLLEEAQSAFDAQNVSLAETLIRRIFEQNSGNFEAVQMLAKILILTQREEEALRVLKPFAKEAQVKPLLVQLAEHFQCRQQMAIRTGKPDPSGFKLFQSAQSLAGQAPNHVGIKLSACLIVKNEADHLRNCLTSLKDVVDEIVVVDTGSTDGTVGIASECGAKLGYFEWCDDFAAARNEALKLATGSWALWIDADEELTPESVEAIRSALIRPQFAGFYIPIVNFTEEEGDGDQFVHAPVRLFRLLRGVQFTGRIHEQVVPSLNQFGLPFATLEKAQLLHHGYRPAMVAERNKVERTVRILETEVSEDPENSFQWFNLANAFTIARRYDEAEEACLKSIENLRPNESHAHNVYQILTEVYEQQGRYREALELIETAESKGLGGIQSEYTKASVLLSLHRYDDALAAINRACEMDWPVGYTGDYSIVTYKRAGLKGQILAAIGRFGEADDLLRGAIEVAPESAPLQWTRANVLEQMGRLEEAMMLFSRLTAEPNLNAKAYAGVGRCARQLGQLAKAADNFESGWHIDPTDVAIWAAWVEAATNLGDTARTLRAYDEYSKHGEMTGKIYVNWGRLLARSGAIEKALDCYTEAIKIEPEDANAYFNCGDLLYQLAQYADAAHLYEGGLRCDPNNPEGWFVLGNSLAQLGIQDGARLAYHQCLKIESGHIGARHNLTCLAA